MEPMRRWAAAQGAPDEELVRMVRAGAFAHFELLVRRHAPRVQRAVRAILRADADVEDAVQQAFLQAFVALRRFEGGSSFSTWLTRIAVNEALMRARRARGRRLLAVTDPDALPSPAAGPEQRAAAREAIAGVQRAAHRLPPGHREVFRLRHVEGLPIAEIAARLGITEAAVKLRLHRARRLLRRALDQGGERPARPTPGTVAAAEGRALTGDGPG